MAKEGKTYIYEGKMFTSIRSLAGYAGINEKTLTARLRRGMPVDAACEKTDFRCSYTDGKSITQTCGEKKKDPDLVRNRLRHGYSMFDALNKPKKITKQGKPIVVNGILYNSIAHALRELGLENRESTVRGRLKAGYPPNEAFLF